MPAKSHHKCKISLYYRQFSCKIPSVEASGLFMIEDAMKAILERDYPMSGAIKVVNFK
jgi:hypothetical protein